MTSGGEFVRRVGRKLGPVWVARIAAVVLLLGLDDPLPLLLLFLLVAWRVRPGRPLLRRWLRRPDDYRCVAHPSGMDEILHGREALA